MSSVCLKLCKLHYCWEHLYENITMYICVIISNLDNYDFYIICYDVLTYSSTNLDYQFKYL